MNLFDQLVTQALKNQPNFSTLRVVVEKELLHHDILRVLSDHKLLSSLTFIGGTCLRMCHGGIRLSEDLDFTGGAHFTRKSLKEMGALLTESLQEKYNFTVHVQDPIKDKNNVDTWKIKVETRGATKHLPTQKINIDICSVPSYEKKPMMVINPYGVDMGTNGLILQTQSLEEIYTDKLLAFALRPNRPKYRDLWDISWLHGKGIQPNLNLITPKLQDHRITHTSFLKHYKARTTQLTSPHHKEEFMREMSRFLPSETIQNQDLWAFILHLLKNFAGSF